MRMNILAIAVSSALLGTAVASADSGITHDQFSAADTDRDGNITLAEAQTGMPTLAADFSSVDANSDGKVSEDELTASGNAGDKATDADQAMVTPPADASTPASTPPTDSTAPPTNK